jgi:hypothetical protein
MLTTARRRLHSFLSGAELGRSGNGVLEIAVKTLADRFRHWFDYERDCNAKTLAMLDAWYHRGKIAQLVDGLDQLRGDFIPRDFPKAVNTANASCRKSPRIR